MKWLAYAVLTVLLAPLAITVLVSFTSSRYLELPRQTWTLEWYRQFFQAPIWLQAISNSLAIAALTAVFSVATGFAAAMALVRGRLRARPLVESVILLPMVLPAVALGAGMLAVVRATPLWGNPLSLALAHSVLAIPVAYLVLKASLKQVDPNLEAAARGLGASPWQVFRFVTLPLAMPGVLAAALFALVISLNEITLTLFLATRDTETLPRVIWPNLRFAITPLVAAASVILLVLTLPALIAAAWWLRPGKGAR